MTLFELDEIEAVLSVKNIGNEAVCPIIRVAIDSRACQEKTLFLGLVGERVNGADYLSQALQNGACAAIIQTPRDAYRAIDYKEIAQQHRAALFLVEQPLQALQKLAKSYVQRFPRLFKIAVTGSSGKTTIKEMLYAIFREKESTIANIGNLNSDIGLPLSCFNIQRHHRYAILEMGMNRIGEIAELVEIFPPDYAIVTNIGRAHIGQLGSQENIAYEKKSIFNHFDGKQVAFIPQRDRFASLLAEKIQGQVVFFSPSTLKRFEHAEDLGLDGWIIYYHNQKIRLRLAGQHNLSNALLCIEVAYQARIKPALIKAGLEKMGGLTGRSEVIRGRITVYNDCYNANPESMLAVLTLFKPLRYARKIAFLGEMRELGEKADRSHAELAQSVIDAGFDAVFLLGVSMKTLEVSLREHYYLGQIFAPLTYEQAEQEIIYFLKDDDLLLIKGSHSLGMQRLLQSLENCGFLWPSQTKEVPIA
ncbi:MAG: UDP-N-acetylmuramoyl-tripeptide--D-alanyl-D-alanine ligase [Spirochaetia bacterium]